MRTAQEILHAMDEVEADLRRCEHRLYALRHELAQRMNCQPGTFGFTEQPDPTEAGER